MTPRDTSLFLPPQALALGGASGGLSAGLSAALPSSITALAGGLPGPPPLPVGGLPGPPPGLMPGMVPGMIGGAALPGPPVAGGPTPVVVLENVLTVRGLARVGPPSDDLVGRGRRGTRCGMAGGTPGLEGGPRASPPAPRLGWFTFTKPPLPPTSPHLRFAIAPVPGRHAVPGTVGGPPPRCTPGRLVRKLFFPLFRCKPQVGAIRVDQERRDLQSDVYQVRVGHGACVGPLTWLHRALGSPPCGSPCGFSRTPCAPCPTPCSSRA